MDLGRTELSALAELPSAGGAHCNAPALCTDTLDLKLPAPGITRSGGKLPTLTGA